MALRARKIHNTGPLTKEREKSLDMKNFEIHILQILKNMSCTSLVLFRFQWC